MLKNKKLDTLEKSIRAKLLDVRAALAQDWTKDEMLLKVTFVGQEKILSVLLKEICDLQGEK